MRFEVRFINIGDYKNIMRRDAQLWWNQAGRDFENAKRNNKFGEYYLVAFLVQQSIEKALKAYFIIKKEEFPDKTHSLIYLGKDLELPQNLLSKLREINPDFVYTRYPDAEGVAPYDAYDERIAKERLEIGEEILEWLRQKIK
ncbi:MAG: HEPN domain-containing protein [Candidatus Woesearchaeota archaeon]